MFEDTNDRRAEILSLLNESPMSATDIAIRFNLHPVIINNDISLLSRVKLIKKCGHHPINTRMSMWRTVDLKTADELRDLIYKRADEKVILPDLPPYILHMMGYNTHGTPKKGRKVNNANFHPTPVRVAPVKFYPGTSWANMEMAL
jgi:DNA-binding transcriptional ArsR family regulator